MNTNLNGNYQDLELVSSYFSTQDSAQRWAKSMTRISWINMNKKPPIKPKYIQVVPKVPLSSSGMKNAPTIVPINTKYFMAQNLKEQSWGMVNQ